MPKQDPLREPVGRLLGARIRDARLAAGLSQEGVALAAELERGYVGEVERGVAGVSVTNLLRIARAIGVPIADLVTVLDELGEVH